MARRNKNTPTVRSLLDAWQRPEEAGEPVAAIATTFELDADFYERELLPRFLGCGHDTFDEPLLFMIEREHRLMKTHAAVLVDSANVAGARTSPRWDQIPIDVPSGCMHSKIVILAWAKAVRLIVSSANITPGAYRINHEIAFTLDFADSDRSPPRAVLLAFLDAVGRYVGMHASEPNATKRLRSSLASIRTLVNAWTLMPQEHAPRAPVQLVPILVEPGRYRFFDGLRAAVGTTRFESCWIMSPFWDDPDEAGSSTDDPAATALRDFLRVRSAKVYLMSRGSLSGSGSPIVQAPTRVRDTLARAVGIDDVLVAPVTLKPGEPEGDRRLHAKGLWLYDDGYSVLVAGSTNFTSAGTGVVPNRCNVEANLALLVRAGTPEYSLLDDIGPPAEEPQPAARAEWTGPPKEGEGEGSTDATAPPFHVAATWHAQGRELTISLLEEPRAGMPWSIHLDENAAREPLWSGAQRDYGIRMRRMTLEDVVGVPAALLMRWERAGHAPFAWIPVHVEDRAALPEVESMRALTVDELLDLLVSGKASWELVHQIKKKEPGGDGQDRDVLDPHKLVDTSGYVTTRTRRFSQALSALRVSLTNEAFATIDGVRTKLFGPLGPLALAQAVVSEAALDASEPSGLMPRELAAFFLTELALILRWIPPPRMLDEGLQAEAVAELAKLLDCIDGLIARCLASTGTAQAELAAYAGRVRRVRAMEAT